MHKTITAVLISLMGILNAKTPIEFQQLDYVTQARDEIIITEVKLIDNNDLTIGSTIEVIGTYKLNSVDNALLGLSITSKENEGKHFPESSEQILITQGSGEFKLIRKIDRSGGIHVSIYPQSESGRFQQSTGRLYFLSIDP